MATVLTSAGKAIVTNRIKGAGTEPVFVAIGSGAGTAAVADTILFTEFTTGTDPGYARASGTSTQQTTTVTNDTYQVIGTLTAGGAIAVTNAGTFDALTVGNLFIHGDFATVNLVNGDSLQLTVKVQFT